MKRVLFLSLLLIGLLSLKLSSQSRLRYAGDDHPPLTVELDYTTVPGIYQYQLLAACALLPPGKIKKWIAIGTIVDIAVGQRLQTDGINNLQWRATLLDADGITKGEIEWTSSGPDRRQPYKNYVIFGATLLDYNRAGIAELDARWVQIRGGMEYCNSSYNARLYSNAWISGRAGMTSMNLQGYTALPAREGFTAFETGGAGRLLLAYRKSLQLSLDADARIFPTHRRTSLMVVGIQLVYIMSVETRNYRNDVDNNGYVCSLLFSVRGEQQWVSSGGASQKVNRLQAVVQYVLDI